MTDCFCTGPQPGEPYCPCEMRRRGIYKRGKQWVEPARPERVVGVSDCLHDNCPECHGTGVKRGGGACIHMIACQCRKCSPWAGAI